MREIRIYQPGVYHVGDTLILSDEAGMHVGVVLRRQVGDKLTLFCGDNREFDARITSVHKKKITVTVLAEQQVNRESPCIIHLAQAISKGERMEIVVQKAVELGVASITPLITTRCSVRLDNERMEKKRLQWQAIAIGACEQSGRNQVPVIYPPCLLVDYSQSLPGVLKFVLCPEGNKTWREQTFSQAEMALVIGPEGGLSPDEMACLQAHDFSPLSLGPRVLRTETAAIVALSVLQAVCGDL